MQMLLFFAAIQILYRMLYKSIYFASEQYVYAVECWLYYALPHGYIFSTETTSDRSRRQCYCSGHSCHDPEDAFLRRLTWVYAGIGIILLAAVFALARTSYGAKLSLLGVQPSEAIKITFCVLYGIFSIQRYQFQGNRSGYSRLQHFTWVFWFSQRTLEVQ